MFEKIKEVIKNLTPEEKEKVKKEIFEEVKEDDIKDEVKTEEPVSSKSIEEEEKSDGVNSEEMTEEEKIVESVSPETNGVRIEDVVLKSELEDRLAALEAKLNAVIKENEDLKNQNSELKGKYEEHDFGTTTKKGILGTAAEVKTEKFDDYAQNFK
jgi:hypothetical protein